MRTRARTMRIPAGPLVSIGTVALLLQLVSMSAGSTLAMVAIVALVSVATIAVCLGLERGGTVLIWCAMLAAPMNDLRLSETSYVTASDLLFVAGFGLLAPILLTRPVQISWLFVTGLVVLLVTGVVASIASADPAVSFSQLIRLVVGAFAMTILFIAWRPRHRVIAHLALAYLIGAVVSVAYALVSGSVEGDEGRYTGLATHPNYFALACILALALIPWILQFVEPLTVRLAVVAGGLVCAFGIWISGSRAALVVLLALVVLYPIVERSVYAAGAVGFVLIGGIVFADRLVGTEGGSAVSRLLGAGSAVGSDTERTQILQEAWDQFTSSPLIGLGFDGGLGAHNIYLQVAVALGIFGLAGYLLILWSGLRVLFWDDSRHLLAYPMLAYLAIGPLTNTLWDRIIWAALALVFAAGTHVRAVQDDGDPRKSATTRSPEAGQSFAPTGAQESTGSSPTRSVDDRD